MEFHHAGVACEDADELADLYGGLFDAPLVHEETVDGMVVQFLDLGNGYFELLEPRAGGTVAEYLENYGPGLHHVALATEDVEAALVAARERDVGLVDEEPRPGAWGHEVAFLRPRDTGGVLVEFVQEH